MSEINTSFIKKDQIIFITQLLNETAKKSEVNINSFSPLLKADTSKLCKISTSQKRSKKFKSQPRTANSQKKGSTVFACRVSDPERYGVPEFDENG